MQDIRITVVYDNNADKPGLEVGWGFSAAVRVAERTVLFDTGREGALLGNLEKLAIEPNSIEVIVLSHIHPDHSGGLESFLGKKSDVAVYLPKSFPSNFKDNVRGFGAEIVEVGQCLEICADVYSTGELGRWIKEQSLILRTDKGLIVITGCAHPGIVKVVSRVKELLKDDILLVMGGFHLEWTWQGKIEKVVSALKERGVEYVGPGHCSGEKARDLLEKDFGENYIKIGAGSVIRAADLE